MSARWTSADLANYQSRSTSSRVDVAGFIQSGSVTTTTASHEIRIVIAGDPVAKPRQTRSDKWKQRPCVLRYREWADNARSVAGHISTSAQHLDIICYLPMPESWSKKKRSEMAGTPHRVKPDIDNLVKSCLDALLPSDQGVHEIKAKKRWADSFGPRVEIIIY